MVTAYILIQTEVGSSHAVTTAIRPIEGVVIADAVTGPYDVIVRAEADTVDDLGRNVMTRIQAIGGITRTVTCPIMSVD